MGPFSVSPPSTLLPAALRPRWFWKRVISMLSFRKFKQGVFSHLGPFFFSLGSLPGSFSFPAETRLFGFPPWVNIEGRIWCGKGLASPPSQTLSFPTAPRCAATPFRQFFSFNPVFFGCEPQNGSLFYCGRRARLSDSPPPSR